ncbi:hypothetical protein MRB53_030300 [Persea americana]|uniref:Uncharacterized protein n=1 Tax=Persea americana TaxID=3435 RepID=A0ACC2KL50_PERAE|nr:hypothetical protein MRB53_030300 [Persea americana]
MNKVITNYVFGDTKVDVLGSGHESKGEDSSFLNVGWDDGFLVRNEAIQGRGDETPNTSSNFLVAVPSEYTVIINKQERAFRAEQFFPGKRWSPHLARVVEGTNWVIDIPFGTESGNEAYGHGLGMLKIRQISWSTKLTVHVILATSMQ